MIRIMWWDYSVQWSIGKAESQHWLCINAGHLMVQVRYWK